MMKKDIEWLKKEIATEMIEIEPNRKEKWSDIKYQTLRSVAQKICQLDEPKILSQEWIDKNVVHVRGLGDIIEAEVIENLLVPKQEITEKQVINWLDNNEFYDHITAETVLERAVDKSELSYYGTKYSVIETPTIPKYVAEWITNHREKFDLYPALRTLEHNTLVWGLIYKWYRTNTQKFVNAYLTGEYKVEEEQKYYVLDTEDIPMLVKSYGAVNRANTHLSIHEKGRNTEHYQLTEQEIKAIDERYWPFAVEVAE